MMQSIGVFSGLNYILSGNDKDLKRTLATIWTSDSEAVESSTEQIAASQINRCPV